ncbi:MAG: hypothetical protein AB1411_11825 [Nitrospirota bacterium]
MRASWVVAAGLLVLTAGCTTKLGTNIATDRVISPGSRVELLGQVRASITYGQPLWAPGADHVMYEEVRQAALKQKGGDLLINAKITTTLTSYLAIYYKTEVAIEGTAAKLLARERSAPSPRMPSPSGKP